MLYDITKPFFGTPTYPGDPAVKAESFYSIEGGFMCNLHTLSFGTHTATHLDAPLHFIKDGTDVAGISLDKCIGNCLVLECDDKVDEAYLEEKLPENTQKLLIKGKGILSPEGAKYLVNRGVHLFGTELNTVGDEITGPEVHRILLGAEIVILENLFLPHIKPGIYMLMAQPVKLEGMDGAPVRAVLMD